MRLLAGVSSAVAVAAVIIAAATSDAFGSSLYSGPGPRPGPDILYRAPATAPQLTNAGIWQAQPILVTGTSVYRSGEFLYQDYLYDDHGAHEVADPTDPRAQGDTFSKPDGTYTYPTDPGYANNAADLVEFRVKPTQQRHGLPRNAEHPRESLACRVLDRAGRSFWRHLPVPVRRQRLARSRFAL